MERLPFQLLPPGTWDVETVVGYYNIAKRRQNSNRSGPTVDVTRLWHLQRLGPTRCYIGTDLWYGYVVFEFNFTSSVVLECAYEGNAIYVLSSDWKLVAMNDKRTVRKSVRHCTKVVHKGDWLERVHQALL
jgi:hypothetical protein